MALVRGRRWHGWMADQNNNATRTLWPVSTLRRVRRDWNRPPFLDRLISGAIAFCKSMSMEGLSWIFAEA